MPITRLSTWCALACKQELFQRFLGVTSEPAAIDAVRTRCGVKSRGEFDRDPEAAARFHEIIRHPYNDFYHAQEESHV